VIYTVIRIEMAQSAGNRETRNSGVGKVRRRGKVVWKGLLNAANMDTIIVEWERLGEVEKDAASEVKGRNQKTEFQMRSDRNYDNQSLVVTPLAGARSAPQL
jgi:hypothetical protein